MRFAPLFLIISLSVLTGLAACADESGRRVDTGIPAGGAADMLKLKQAPEAISPSDTTAIKMTLTCTDASGETVKKGEEGYNACMNHYKLNGGVQGPFKTSKAPGTTVDAADKARAGVDFNKSK